jgi:hypothetical protein
VEETLSLEKEELKEDREIWERNKEDKRKGEKMQGSGRVYATEYFQSPRDIKRRKNNWPLEVEKRLPRQSQLSWAYV